MYVCLCKGVTETQVRQLGRSGAVTAGALINVLQLDDDRCCGRCIRSIDSLVALAMEPVGAGEQAAV
jgi:bacterioferritin-associated ferredoxin